MKRKHIFIFLVVFSLALPLKAHSTVIYSETYDCSTAWNNWNSTQASPACSTLATAVAGSSTGSDTYDGVTHYVGESSSGGRSGNSLKQWRRNGGFAEYGGYLDYFFSSSLFDNHHKSLFSRVYVKIPPQIDASCGGSCPKFMARGNFGTSAGDYSGEIYFDIYGGSTMKTSPLRLYITSAPGAYANWFTSSNITALGLNDGNWHCLEVNVKLNSTTGSSDGEVHIWLDGNEQQLCDGSQANCGVGKTGLPLGVAANQYYNGPIRPGIGNLTSGSWNMSDNHWHAFEWDDFVLSTTYVGPSAGGGDTNQPTVTNLLSEGWESNNTLNWQCDYVQGSSRIVTSPVHSGTHSFRMPCDTTSVNYGNYVYGFGAHPQCNPNGTMVSDVTWEEWIYFPTDFVFPSSDTKLWLMNSFESWGANYSTAAGQGKPNAWAPYYMTINVDGNGRLHGQFTRADNLGGTNTGVLWQDYPQNQGTATALSKGSWQHIKMRMKLNSLGQSDGIFQIWINDVLKASYTNMNYRASLQSYGWNHLMISMDSNPQPSVTQYSYRDDIVLTTTDSSGLLAPTGLSIE